MKTAMHNAKWNPLWCRFSISSRIPLCSRGPVHRITHSSSDFDGRLSRAIPFIGRERGKRGWRGREITSRRRSNLYPLSLSVDRVFYCAGKQIVAREIILFNRVPRRRMWRILWNGTIHTHTHTHTHVEMLVESSFIASISQRDSFEQIPLPFEFSSNCASRSFLSWTIGPMFIRWIDWLCLSLRLGSPSSLSR